VVNRLSSEIELSVTEEAFTGYCSRSLSA